MPFRSKLKKAFGRSPSESEPSGSPTAAVSSEKKEKSGKKRLWTSKSKEWDNWPEHLYKPNEVPAPKYKRTPAKEHTEALEAYTWADASSEERRGSVGSQYSPMGSKLQSRRSSGIGPGGVVLGRSGLAHAELPLDAPPDSIGVITGRDPSAENLNDDEDDEDGGALAKTATLKPVRTVVPAPAAAAAESRPSDAFDTAQLTRALTAIKDGKVSVSGHASAAATPPPGVGPSAATTVSPAAPVGA